MNHLSKSTQQTKVFRDATRSTAPRLTLLHLLLGGLCAAGGLTPLRAFTEAEWVINRPPDEVGLNHSTWIVSDEVSSRKPGAAAIQSRVTVLASGVHYWDETDAMYRPSDPSFDIDHENASFVASKVQTPVSISANLNRIGAVRLKTPDGTDLHSTPVGIGLLNAETGEVFIIGTVTDNAGVLIGDSQVLFESAFEGVDAAILFTLTAGSFAQDVIFTGKLNPADWGVDPEVARIQIITEFYGAPRPDRIRRPLHVERNESVRRRMAVPDMIDEVIGFNDFVIGTGRAYTAPSEANPSGSLSVVAKEYRNAHGRAFLIETVRYSSLREAFEALPPAEDGAEEAAATRAGIPAKAYAAIPIPPEAPLNAALPVRAPIEVAQAFDRQSHGVLIDYTATLGGNVNSAYVLQGDTTYVIGTTLAPHVYFNGHLTIEGGAILKYNADSSIQINNTLTLKTSHYRPAVLTALVDNSVGTTVAQGSLDPNGYADPAIELGWQNYTLSHLRFRYAKQAVRFSAGDYEILTIKHAQFVKCVRGIRLDGNGSGLELHVLNSLLAEVQIPLLLETETSIQLHHCTVAEADQLIEDPMGWNSHWIHARNTVFANIQSTGDDWYVTFDGGNNGFYQASAVTSGTTLQSSPFEGRGSGNYYLDPNSPLKGTGNASSSPGLVTGLTPERPQLIENQEISTETTWTPAVVRSSGSPLDPGYHYPPIDYLVSQVDLTGHLKLIGGVVVALHGSVGIRVESGGILESTGTPARMNTWIYSQAAQEEPVTWAGQEVLIRNTASSQPEVRFRFNHFVSLAETPVYAFLDGDASVAPIEISHSFFEGGRIWLETYNDGAYQSIINFTNNIFERTTIQITHYPDSYYGTALLYAYNNLFWKCDLGLVYDDEEPYYLWEVYDNVFDKCRYWGWGDFFSDHNAYEYACSGSWWCTPTWDLMGSNDLFPSSLTYVSIPEGRYYLPSNSDLIDYGSRSAVDAGLRDFTTQVNGPKEGLTQVDIGFHYAVDTSGDGIPDYWRVQYGLDPDVEIPDPNDPNDPHALAGDPNLDGISNWEHYLAGTHPLRPNSQNITSGGVNYKSMTLASTSPPKAYDVYYRPNVNAQWRRVSSGVAGQKAFMFVNPNPSAEGDYIFLDAADQDGDGLSDGYENWFTYIDSQGQVRRTNPLDLYSYLIQGDSRKDGWKVAYGVNPMDGSSDPADANGWNYKVNYGEINEDPYTSQAKHDFYYETATGYDASYDALKLTGSAEVRPVVTISQSEANAFSTSTFTISRDVGSGSDGDALLVHFSVGGNLVYRRDYVLIAPAGVTLNDQSPPFSVTILENQLSVDITIVMTPSAVPASNLIVALVPYASAQ